LYNQYESVFPTGNRNAASFKWFSYIVKCAKEVGPATFETLGKGFCAISGSPISGGNSAKVKLNRVDGGSTIGAFHYCCDPCICDMIDMVKVDKFVVQFGHGTRDYNVLVHGDPCKNKEKLHDSFKDPFSGQEETLGKAAPEVACEGDELKGATFSKNGHPIIGLFYDEPVTTVDGTLPETEMECAERAKQGFASGMGLIFRKVAAITPL
jgi:hypothetical protein